MAREGGPWRLWLAGALGLTGLVVAAAVPALRQPVLVAAQAGTAVVVLVSARSRRPAVARLWWAAPGWFLVSALLGARVLAAGGATPLTRALAPGTVIGLLAVVLPEELRARRARPRDASRHQWADGAIVLAGAGLLAGRSASGVSLDPDVAGDPLRVLTAATGLVAFGMLGWVVTARRDPPAATLLISSACAVFVLTQTWLALSPASSAAATAPQALVLTAATVLFALGTLAPSRVAVGTAPVAPRAGLGSRRIIVLLPFAVVPSAVSVLDLLTGRSGERPWVVAITGAVITTLALLRASSLLRASEAAAEVDPLTRLLNRRGLLRQLAVARTAGQPVWAAVVDLNGFKGINDRYGHLTGDVVLSEVGRRLGALAGVTARPGGDEFVVVRPGADPDALTREVLDCFREPVLAPGFQAPVTASTGIAPVRAWGDLDGCLADADVAMYAAKQRGGARAVRYDDAVRVEVSTPGALRSDVRALLGAAVGATAPAGEHPVGELVVHYQPVVALGTGQPLGVEALVRWEHPQLGRIAPDAFVPVAEDLGLGAALDLAVAGQAVHQLAAWDAMGLRVHRLGLNLGRGSLASTSLVPDLVAACAHAGVGLDRLLLEITEQDAAPSDAACAARIQRLADAGATIALDDFGTGYSGVGYLLRFPITLLKLDRSLLPGAVAHPARGATDAHRLLQGVAALARTAGLEVTAEGIETTEHEDFVRAIGVDHGQGWRYAPALGPAELAAYWLTATAAAEQLAAGSPRP